MKNLNEKDNLQKNKMADVLKNCENDKNGKTFVDGKIIVFKNNDADFSEKEQKKISAFKKLVKDYEKDGDAVRFSIIYVRKNEHGHTQVRCSVFFENQIGCKDYYFKYCVGSGKQVMMCDW